MEVGEEGDYKLYLSLLCHHLNNSCNKVGSDESHFNVSLTVRDKITKQCPQSTTVEEKGEPKRIRTEVPLGLPGQRLTARPNRLTQRERERDRQTDRQTDRYRETERDREREEREREYHLSPQTHPQSK